MKLKFLIKKKWKGQVYSLKWKVCIVWPLSRNKLCHSGKIIINLSLQFLNN